MSKDQRWCSGAAMGSGIAVRWIGSRRLVRHELAARPKLKTIKIFRRGAWKWNGLRKIWSFAASIESCSFISQIECFNVARKF